MALLIVDATGEIYDDYSAKHITTQKSKQLKARFKRMDYIAQEKGMVVVWSGNDFA